ncbi:MAG: hypothetical protein DMG44_18315 [Acidobacteria bacterium]|nr:MAG: hypothetical protein DMG44_18315 [Acidobacteriota bacterium]
MVPLRTKCSSALLAAVLIFASGCHKQSTELSPEQSETKEAFEIAQAMKMFYGNYDVKKQTSVASLPKEKSSFPAAGEEQMTVRPLFHAFSGDAGAHNFLPCAPTIGMAVF